MYFIGGMFNLEGSKSSYRTITEEVLVCGESRVVQGHMKTCDPRAGFQWLGNRAWSERVGVK